MAKLGKIFKGHNFFPAFFRLLSKIVLKRIEIVLIRRYFVLGFLWLPHSHLVHPQQLPSLDLHDDGVQP